MPFDLSETEVEDVIALPDDAVQLYAIEGHETVSVPPNDQSYVWGALA